MSAGSCVASRSRSRLDISASFTWAKSDSRRASRRSRYDFVFLLSIPLYAPSLTPLVLKPCVYASRGPRFQKRPAELSLLIGQPARDGISAVELLRQDHARRQLLRTPNGLARHVEENRQGF